MTSIMLWETSAWGQVSNSDGIVLEMWWITNSSGHSKVWTVNLFHTIKLQEFLIHQISNTTTLQVWCSYDRCCAQQTDIMLKKLSNIFKLPRDVSFHYMFLPFAELEKLFIIHIYVYRKCTLLCWYTLLCCAICLFHYIDWTNNYVKRVWQFFEKRAHW